MRPFGKAFVLVIACATSVFGADQQAPNRPVPDVIDHYIDAKIRDLGIEPAGPADDATLIRRLMLDLVGRIPTPVETKAYVASTDPNKRAILVDRLMASPAFVRHQATQFEAMLSGPTAKSSGLRDYLVRALGENRTWDAIFRDLLMPDETDVAKKGSSEFLKSRISDLDRVTNDVSVVFFGVNVSCAQCHDHPLVNDWKQDHFYGMKSFFVRTFDNGGFLAEKDNGLVRFKPSKGPERQAKMMFLTGSAIEAPGQKELSKDEEKKEQEKFEQAKKDKKAPPAPAFSARAKLVEVALQSKEGDFFSRSIVNRLWHRFFGFGMVMPLDQMHSENKPSHPELLDWLARDASAHKYDLRRTIRGIVMSKTYSRSSKYGSESVPGPGTFAVARLKPMTPMQLATSIKIASASPQQFENVKPDELEKRIEAIEASARGLASSIAPPTDDFQIGVGEALLFSNSDKAAREFLQDSNNSLLGLVKTIKDPAAAIDLIGTSILCRPMETAEKAALVEYVGRRADRLPEAYKQVIWALITSSEFRFNY